jgi:DNA repair exonuclease SbcCD ATPase subunit
MVKQEVVLELNEKIDELSQTINMLADENTLMRDKIAIGQWDASEIEKIDAEETIKDLREQLRVLDLDNKALRQSRDMFQNRNSELMKTVKSLQSKLKKLDQGN